GEAEHRPIACQDREVKASGIVPNGDVALVGHLPEAAKETLVAANPPFGGEVHLLLAVPAPCCADGAGPFEYVVGVDAASDGVLPSVEVPEFALDGEAAMLDPCASRDALDIKRDHPRVHGRGDAGLNVLQAVG